MNLNEIAVFVKVVELGSFSKAAQSLGMPNSTVSAKVSDLEARLGVTLIKRTTRRLFITDEGKAFFERSQKGLDEIRRAEEDLSSGQKEPQGLLKVTAPIELGSAILPAVIAEFKKKHLKVGFDLFLSDRKVDLIAEGYDLAIRAGELKDSSLIAKKLGSVYFAPFASSQYLRRNGSPDNPRDLRQHCCLQFTPMGLDEWKLVGPKGSVTVPMARQIVINELNVLKSLTISGLGIAMLPTFLCYPEVQSGKLVRVLPEWRSNLSPVHFLYPGQKHTSAKVSAFIAIASEKIKDSLQNYEL